MNAQTKIRVFLSHNSSDKRAVEVLAKRLRREGLEPWLDLWNLIPGQPYQPAIEAALAQCECCAVFVGPSGVAPWQREEMRIAIARRIKDPTREFRVVPVHLPGAERGNPNQLPSFLDGTTWVEFNQTLDDADAFHRLLCGIRGREPGAGPGGGTSENEISHARSAEPKRRWRRARQAVMATSFVALTALSLLIMYGPWEQLRWAAPGDRAVPAKSADKPQTQGERKPVAPINPGQTGELQRITESKLLAAHTECVSCVAFFSGGNAAVSVSNGERKLREWNLATGDHFEKFTWFENNHDFVLAKSGNRVLGSYSDDLWVSDVTNLAEPLWKIGNFGAGSLGPRAFSDNGRRIIFARGHAGDFNLTPVACVVDVETGKTIGQFEGHGEESHMRSVALSSDGKWAASAANNGLFIWEVMNPMKMTVRIDRPLVISLAFSLSGDTLLAGEKSGALMLWDVQTGKELRRFGERDGHIGAVNCVAFSPVDQRVLSGGDDQTASLWDLQTGMEVARLKGHTGRVTTIAFAPDGKRALTGSADKTVRLWDLPAMTK